MIRARGVKLLHVDGVDACYALDNHYDFRAAVRTTIGQLVYRAKPYGQKGSDPRAVDDLGTEMAKGLHNPVVDLSELQAVTAVPAHQSKQHLNLPDLLAEAIADQLGAPCRHDLVVKVRQTPEAKRLPNDEKQQAVAGAYEAAAAIGGHVLLVDDLLYSGATVSEVAHVLRSAGAERVTVVVATHVKRGMG